MISCAGGSGLGMDKLDLDAAVSNTDLMHAWTSFEIGLLALTNLNHFSMQGVL